MTAVLDLVLDMDLVREFARDHSEAAFTELVRRHINLVYSVARRCSGNDGDAQDVTQAVFVILARKAAGLHARTVLAGWLYETTRHTAACLQRTNVRRHIREQEAYMQSTLAETDTAVDWARLQPCLEAGMSQLGERDRTLLALRFYQNKSGPEAAAMLGLREAAVHKRTARAVEKLRKFFTKRGVALSAAAIAGAVSANSVQAAPAALAETISIVAVAKGAAATTSSAALVKGTLKIMTHAKLKLAIGTTVGLLMAGSAAMLGIAQATSEGRMTARDIVKRTQTTYANLSSYSDSGTVVTEGGGGPTTETTFTIQLQRPNLYQIDWTETSDLRTNKGVVWSDGSGNYLGSDTTDKLHSMQFALPHAGEAKTIPAIFFSTYGGYTGGDVLAVAAMGKESLAKMPDQNIGGVDCQVVSTVFDMTTVRGGKKDQDDTGAIGPVTNTFWIGKQDHLIRQLRETMADISIRMPELSDERVKEVLEQQHKPATPQSIAAWRTQMDAMAKRAQGTIMVFSQTHQDIVVNQRLSPEDFAP